jgi:flagellar basal-body rod modification protein FlgD
MSVGGVSDTSAAQVNSTTTQSTSNNTDIGADQDKFMTLLVTQLKNQDPLNPMDNAAMTSQLAQLSTVQGINQVNATLQALRSDQASQQSVQATNLIGKGVMVAGNSMTLNTSKSSDGTTSVSGAVFGYDLASPADDVSVQVLDKSGAVVDTIDLGATKIGSYTQVWDGKDQNGKQLADGDYTFKITSTSAGKALTDTTALSLAAVTSVSTGSGGTKLNTSLGQFVMSDVKQVM